MFFGFDTTFLFIAIIGIILFSLLFFKRSIDRTSTLFLSGFYFIFSIYALQTYVIEAGLLSKYPWFYAWPLPIYSVIVVPVYFYFITIIDDAFKWQWKYLLLFVPFVLSCLDLFVLFSKPITVYTTIVRNADAYPAERFSVVYGFLSLTQHSILRHLWQFIALLAILPRLRNFISMRSSEKLKITLNRWLVFFYISLILISFLMTTFGIERMLDINIFQFVFRYPPVSIIVRVISYLLGLGIVVIPIYFPSILYGFPRSTVENLGNNTLTKILEEPKYGLDVKGLKINLELLKQRELFLARDFDLAACARELQIPIHHVSYFLNQYVGLSFSSYRNNLRIDKAKILIDGGYLATNTIEALAWECGFASRSGFSKTFKNQTNQSISEYVSKPNYTS